MNLIMVLCVLVCLCVTLYVFLTCSDVFRFKKIEGYDSNNEEIDDISANLSSYFSCFSDLSYPGTGRVWTDLINNKRHFMFGSEPSFTSSTGFVVNSTPIVGPMSMDLGIMGNSSFSIAFCCNFSDFVGDTELFKIFSNSDQYNGLSISIPQTTVRLGNLFAINLEIKFGSQVFGATDPSNHSPVILLTPGKVYMFVIVKDRSNISLFMFQDLESLSNDTPKIVLLDKALIYEDKDMLFSNRECVINGTSNMNAALYNFGFYNKGLSDTEIVKTLTHMQNHFRRSNRFLIDNKKKECVYEEVETHTVFAAPVVTDPVLAADTILEDPVFDDHVFDENEYYKRRKWSFTSWLRALLEYDPLIL